MKRVWLGLFLIFTSLSYAQDPKSGDMTKRGYKETDFPKIHKLAGNVYAYEMISAPVGPDRFTTNCLFVITTDGVLVTDGQGNPAFTAQMVAEIRKLTNQPIKYVVMGSDHGDHTNGNISYPETAVFIAHPISKTILETQANAPNRNPNAPRIVVPDELVTDKRILRMGDTEIQILYLGRAHAGGDLVVYLPKEKVLYTSEIFFHRLYPSLRRGFPTEWVEALKKVEQIDAEWFIPGHGFIDDARTMKEEVTEFRKAMEKVVSETKRLYKPGATAEQIAEAFKQANFAPYSSWTYYGTMGLPAFTRAWDELDGKLRQ
jgi:glyoxylase-like metal-dependent hydrolase (beta-lactamase superfamily II)